MEDRYGVGDYALGESDSSEQDFGNIPVRKRKVHIEGTKEHEERIKRLEHAVKSFRIESAGDGILRGGFGKLPDNPAKDLLDRMNDLSKAMDQFNLTGDGLQVSGSFDKGYSVSRENPCEQQQVNENPT